MCFKCGDKWTKEHKYKADQVFLVTEDDEEVKEEEEKEEEASGDEYLQLVESSAIQDNANVSLDAISKATMSTTMRVLT